jgi:hypothetical protein
VSVEAEYEDFAQSRPLIVPDWLSATQYCEGGGLRGCPQCNYDKGAPMQRTLTYIVGFLGAAVAAVMLYVLVQEERGIGCTDKCDEVERGKGSWHELNWSPGFLIHTVVFRKALRRARLRVHVQRRPPLLSQWQKREKERLHPGRSRWYGERLV